MNNGFSWVDAYQSLDLALSQAAPGDTLLLAEGTYFPTVAPPNGPALPRGASFLLTDGITIQGGFLGLAAGPIGGSINPDNPDGSADRTILDGNIGSPGVSTDNAYSVVTVRQADSQVVQVLKDLTIQGGFADDILGADPDDPDPIADGAAVYNDEANIELDGVILLRNFAARDGGAVISATGGDGYFGLKSSRFFGNVAGRRGGAAFLSMPGHSIEETNGPPDAAWVYNCSFVSNLAGETGPTLAEQGGGAVWFGIRGSNGDPVQFPISLSVAVANNTVLRNGVRGSGAAYYIEGSNELQVDICNDTIANNFVIETANVNNVGGILYYEDGQGGDLDPPLTIRNTIIQSNQDLVNFRSVEGPGTDRLEMRYSNVARVGTLGTGGAPGLPAVWPGIGNMNQDPLFMNLAGGDVRLQAASPSIDTGSDGELLPDHADLDEDHDTGEATPRAFVIVDPRIIDFLGNGPGTCGQMAPTCGLVDMGAHEKL